MAALNLAAMNAALKELYDGQTVENLVYKNNPLMAMLKKNTDFGGKYKPVPIQIGVSQGRAATFANAQGNQTAAQLQEFLLTRVTDYSIATIDNQTMLASATDKMSFLNGAKLLVDSAIRSCTNSIASAQYRTGTGSIGQIASVSGAVITLQNPADVVQFETNMTIQANSTDGGTPRAALGYIVKVDRSAGTLTVSATSVGGSAALPSGWAAGDFLLVQGDLNAKCAGLAAWLPGTAPVGGDNFFGVDRSVDTTRLGGVRYDGSAQSIEESLIDAAGLLAREGGSPDKCFVSFASYQALEKSIGSKVQYVNVDGPAKLGFKGIVVTGASSTFEVYADRNCQPQQAWLMSMENWAVEGLGDVPGILRYGEGFDMLRVSNADAAELRVGAYYNISCNAPGWSANVKLSA